MRSFSGFPAGKVHLTPIPAPFFTELLPEIDHLGELKIVLYAMWILDRQEGTIRYFTLADCLADARLMNGFGATPQVARPKIEEALERAVTRGVLLRIGGQDGKAEGHLYFLNSPRGKAAIEALRMGEWAPAELERVAPALEIERPNIFKLYEDNIGVLTPMISEMLIEASQTYPEDWIEDAIQSAVENNVRRWRYVEAILRSWKERGRHGQDR